MKKKTTPMVNLSLEGMKPETSNTLLRDLKRVLKALDNKEVHDLHIEGNGSKYLHIYKHQPVLTIRCSDHPTGNDEAINVKSKDALIAESIKKYLKIK